jgi:hypothetical protein
MRFKLVGGFQTALLAQAECLRHAFQDMVCAAHRRQVDERRPLLEIRLARLADGERQPGFANTRGPTSVMQQAGASGKQQIARGVKITLATQQDARGSGSRRDARAG